MPSERSECVCRLPRNERPEDANAGGRTRWAYPAAAIARAASHEPDDDARSRDWVCPFRIGRLATAQLSTEFRRDRLTWIAYVVLAWFAYLQAAPGLVIGHLRDELDLSYSTGGLHVAAFAAGALVAGVVSARLEHVLGRRGLFWSAAALMGAGAIGLTAG